MNDVTNFQKKGLSEDAKQFLKDIKQKGKKIVFTNGCFDILHVGHISYLNKAKSLADFLFVGLNSDSSVKNLKGNSRPINKQEDRKIVLENLKAVDFVEIFYDETPLSLIKEIAPDILVKGGDWKVEQIVGADYVLSYGGQVKSLPFITGYSSTTIIEIMSGQKY